MTSTSARGVGLSGEDLAAAWYEARGFEIVVRNWRCREGELDLIVRDGRLYVFCEVKARSGLGFGSAAEAVTRDKQQRLRRLAARWLESDAPVLPREIRFDVAAVSPTGVEMIEGAF